MSIRLSSVRNILPSLTETFHEIRPSFHKIDRRKPQPIYVLETRPKLAKRLDNIVSPKC